MNNEKEINKYLDTQRKSNPLLMGNDSGKFYREFVRMGFVKKNELQLNKFISNSNNEALIQKSSILNENILIRRGFDDSIGVWKISTISDKDSATIEFAYEFSELKCWLLDIIPGGNQEIVVLNQHYIMNGENFDLLVYEIKTSN